VAPNTTSPALRIVGNDQTTLTGQWIAWPGPTANATFIPVQNLTGVGAALPMVDAVASRDDPSDVLATFGWFWFDGSGAPATGGTDAAADGGEGRMAARMHRREAARTRRRAPAVNSRGQWRPGSRSLPPPPSVQ
jgi:hypothetical protein